MPTFTLSNDPRFPAGTTLHAYPAVGNIPAGAAADSGVVQANGSCTFDDVAYLTRYLAGTSPSGPFVAFRTDAEPGTDEGSGSGTPLPGSVSLASLSDALKALLVVGRVHDGANYPERITGVAFNHWVGPVEPPDFEDGDVWTPTA